MTETLSALTKVITFGPTILVLLEFQFSRLRADFGVYFMLEAYSDKLTFYLAEKNAGKLVRERRNQNSKSAKILR